MKYRDMTMEEAQDELLRHRPHINPKLTERPVVREFAETMQEDATV
jgi:atypical dual specificity phosphatase